MQVWLLHIGEQLPIDGHTRPFRYTFLARALEENGHSVLRWAPTFCHVTKRHRLSTDGRIAISDRYAIQLVHSTGYRRNASLTRLYAYRVLARRFRQLAARQPRPDVIVAAIPSLEWARAAIDYGQANRVPVVIDVRDLWPDVLLNALPSALRFAGRPLLAPFERTAQYACARASALTAVSNSYLDWALNHAGRAARHDDLVVPLGYELQSIAPTELTSQLAKLRELGVDPSRPICLFAGLFERSCDLGTVIEAARRLEANGSPAQFVLCGDGSRMVELKRRAVGLCNVVFPGWIDVAMLQAVAAVAAIGLCAYAADALQSLPNKPFEYMASRLAIVSSLRGELADLLDQQDCGITYRAGDAESLAQCLLELLGNPHRLCAMGANAHRVWSRQYRSGEIYARFANHLAVLAQSRALAA